MAERKFDYENVKSIYEKINRTIGSEGDSGSDTIIGILNSIDKTYKDMVNVKDKAVLGDLGRQLLLDWENTSSDFPNFIANFQNWSALVAQAGGDYQAFEDSVNTIKSTYTYGLTGVDPVTGQPITNGYVNTGVYSYYDSETVKSIIDEMSLDFFEMEGTEYVDTGAVRAEKTREIFAWVALVGNSVSIIADGVTIVSSIGKISQFGMGGTAVGRLLNTTKNVNTAAKSVKEAKAALEVAELSDNADDILKAAGQLDEAEKALTAAKLVKKANLKGVAVNIDDYVTGAKQFEQYTAQAAKTRNAFKTVLHSDIGTDDFKNAVTAFKSENKLLKTMKAGDFTRLSTSSDEVMKLANITDADDVDTIITKLTDAVDAGTISDADGLRVIDELSITRTGDSVDFLLGKAGITNLDDADNFADTINSAVKSGKITETEADDLIKAFVPNEAGKLVRTDFGSIDYAVKTTMRSVDDIKADITRVTSDISKYSEGGENVDDLLNEYNALKKELDLATGAGTKVDDVVTKVDDVAGTTMRSVDDIKADITRVTSDISKYSEGGENVDDLLNEYNALKKELDLATGAGTKVDDVVTKVDDVATKMDDVVTGTNTSVDAVKTSSVTDDMVDSTRSMTTAQKREYIEGLIENGTIKNEDDFMKFFNGDVGTAKTTMGSSSRYREIIKGFDTTDAAGDVAGTIGTDSKILDSAVDTSKGVDGISSIDEVTDFSKYGLDSSDSASSAFDKLDDLVKQGKITESEMDDILSKFDDAFDVSKREKIAELQRENELYEAGKQSMIANKADIEGYGEVQDGHLFGHDNGVTQMDDAIAKNNEEIARLTQEIELKNTGKSVEQIMKEEAAATSGATKVDDVIKTADTAADINPSGASVIDDAAKGMTREEAGQQLTDVLKQVRDQKLASEGDEIGKVVSNTDEAAKVVSNSDEAGKVTTTADDVSKHSMKDIIGDEDLSVKYGESMNPEKNLANLGDTDDIIAKARADKAAQAEEMARIEKEAASTVTSDDDYIEFIMNTQGKTREEAIEMMKQNVSYAVNQNSTANKVYNKVDDIKQSIFGAKTEVELTEGQEAAVAKLVENGMTRDEALDYLKVYDKKVTPGVERAQAVSDTVSGAKDKVVTKVDPVVQKGKDIVQPVVDKVKPVVQPVVDKGVGIVKAGTEKVGQAGVRFNEFVEGDSKLSKVVQTVSSKPVDTAGHVASYEGAKDRSDDMATIAKNYQQYVAPDLQGLRYNQAYHNATEQYMNEIHEVEQEARDLVTASRAALVEKEEEK